MNYFAPVELSCKCCGANKFNPETLSKLNKLRELVGHPITLSSAYRCEAYNKRIGATQTHATGQAVDVLVSGAQAYDVIKKAIECGFNGIGVSQKGDRASRFIHIDDLPINGAILRPAVWSY